MISVKQGFTLIELLLVIGLSVVLIAAAVPLYTNLQVSSQLNEASAQLVQNARLIRTMSAARLNNTPHGIYFDISQTGADRYVMFEGPSYATRTQSYDRIIALDSVISLSSSLSGSSNEIVFSPTFGIPSATGTIVILHAVSGSRTISINRVGTISYE